MIDSTIFVSNVRFILLQVRLYQKLSFWQLVIVRKVFITWNHSIFIINIFKGTYGRLAQYFSIRAGSSDQLSGGQVIRVNISILSLYWIFFTFWDGSGKIIKKNTEFLQVSKIINHPNYNVKTVDYDFALLSLAASINLDGRTKAVIALPLANELIADGTVVQISGWGTTSESSKLVSRYLRGTTVLTVNQLSCSSAYGRYGAFISKQMVCAGSTGKDTCSVRNKKHSVANSSRFLIIYRETLVVHWRLSKATNL